LCSVEARLRQSGFVARRVPGKPVKRAGFSVMPAVYTLGRGHLEVFIYADSAAMARDMAKMDTLSVAPPGTPSVFSASGSFGFSSNARFKYVRAALASPRLCHYSWTREIRNTS